MELPLPITLINWLIFAIAAAITALTAIGFKPAVKFLKAHAHGRVFEVLRKWAYTYVSALAQDPSLKGLASEEKKQQAMLWLVIKSKQLGIELSEMEASNLVEEAVYLVKKVTLPQLEDALANSLILDRSARP
jgi:hypothetical protein